MSSEQDQVRQLAERIARRVAQSSAEQMTAQPSAGAIALEIVRLATRWSGTQGDPAKPGRTEPRYKRPFGVESQKGGKALTGYSRRPGYLNGGGI